MIALALGKRATIQSLPEQAGDVKQTFAAIDRAKSELRIRAFNTVRRRHQAVRRVVSVRPMSPR